jgi:hypothetical protein
MGSWRFSLALLLLGLGLAACRLPQVGGPSPQEREQTGKAERNRRDRERCLRDRELVGQQLAQLSATQRELARVRASTYVPSPRPEAPDPALAPRFSQADQELDALRHQEALALWRQGESQRYDAWLQTHTTLQRRLELQERREMEQLRRRNSSLFEPTDPSRLNPRAVEKYSNCDPARF